MLLALAWFASAHADVPIVKLSVKTSNAYLIKSTPPVLVDAGAKGSDERLLEGLRENGVELKDLSLVIFTHGHHDHAGMGAWLRQQGVRVAIGAGDVALAKAGHNDELRPMRLIASLVKIGLSGEYPPFEPDEAIAAERAFAWGKVVPMPGHTAGSLVVLLNAGPDGRYRDAIVGDQMLGGAFGGALFPSCPSEHYFQADPEANHRNIRALLAQGVQTFYLGHGGPVAAADVAKEFGEEGAK